MDGNSYPGGSSTNGDLFDHMTNGYHQHALQPLLPHPQQAFDTPQFPWLAAQQSIGPSDLPQASGPLVFEGYVPGPFELPNHPPSPEEVAFSIEPGDEEPATSYDTVSSMNGNSQTLQALEAHTESDHVTANGGPNQPQDQQLQGVLEAVPPRRGRGRPRKVYAHLPKRATGHRGGWSKGLKLGPRPVVEPTAEFKDLQQQAVFAFIEEGDDQKALELINQAISVNPEIYAAHQLLSQIHFSMGNEQEAVGALWAGAHTYPTEPHVWKELASACQERTNYDRRIALEQAKYAVSILVRLETENLDWRFQRAKMEIALEKPQKAVNDLNFILRAQPHNSDALALRAQAWCEMSPPRVKEAIAQYKDEITYFMDVGLDGEDTFEWKDLKTYVDVLTKRSEEDQTAFAVRTLKKLSRWLLGRRHENFWDDVENDDCEYDAEDEPRRELVPGFVPGRNHEDAYGIGLPLEVRTQLGLLRYSQGTFRDEALAHFEWLGPEEGDLEMAERYWDLYRQVGLALNEAKEYAEALRYLEVIQDVEHAHNHDFWVALGESSYMCGKKDEAMEHLEAALDHNNDSVEARTHLSIIKADKGQYQAALTEAKEAVEIAEALIPKTGNRKYERKEQRMAREAAQRAYNSAYKLAFPKPRRVRKPRQNKPKAKPTASRKARNVDKLDRDVDDESMSDDDEDLSDFERRFDPEPEAAPKPPDTPEFPAPKPKRRKPNRIAPRQLPVQGESEVARQDRVLRLSATLDTCTEAMRSGDATAKGIWVDCASSMIQEFRVNKNLFVKKGESHTTHSLLHSNQRSLPAAADEPSPATNLSFNPDSPLPSVEPSTAPSTVFGLTFDTWLSILLEYAILLSQSSTATAKDDCYSVLNIALRCVAWRQSIPHLTQIHVCFLSCCISLQDQITLYSIPLRFFMKEYILSSRAYTLYSLITLFFPYPSHSFGKEGQITNAAFRNRPNSRFLHSHLASIDHALPNDYSAGDEGPIPDFMRRNRDEIFTAYRDDSHGNKVIVQPQEMNVVLLVLLGQIAYANGNFVEALSYFFRARNVDEQQSSSQQKNPLVSLSLALCYFHQLFKKQNENRHMYVLQGWAFLEEYAEARMEWARARDDGNGDLVRECEREVEFNRARCWQMLGMGDLAVRAYWEVIRKFEVVELGRQSDEEMLVDSEEGLTAETSTPANEQSKGWKMQAAYAIATTYATNGDTEAAREITEKYLVIE